MVYSGNSVILWHNLNSITMKAKYLKTNYKEDNMFILIIDSIILAIFNCPKGTDLYPKIEQYFKSEQDNEAKIFGDKYEYHSINIKLCDTIDNDIWSISFPVIYQSETNEKTILTYELRRFEGGIL